MRIGFLSLPALPRLFLCRALESRRTWNLHTTPHHHPALSVNLYFHILYPPLHSVVFSCLAGFLLPPIKGSLNDSERYLVTLGHRRTRHCYFAGASKV